jgi:hypothetical protein
LGRLTEFDGVLIRGYRAGGWDGFLSLTSTYLIKAREAAVSDMAFLI